MEEKIVKVRSLSGGSVGDDYHEIGDVVEAPASQAAQWVRAGIAEYVDPQDAPTPKAPVEKDVPAKAYRARKKTGDD